MKKIALILALFPLSGFAFTNYETARVESFEPVQETTRTPGQCRYVTTTESTVPPAEQNRGIAGSVIGGVVGGLLGNQVGGGSGRTVATAAGAITGAIVGGNMDRNSSGGQRNSTTREVCDPESVVTRTTGYRVNYNYQGQRGTITTTTPPGSTIEMRVIAEPVVH